MYPRKIKINLAHKATVVGYKVTLRRHNDSLCEIEGKTMVLLGYADMGRCRLGCESL